MDRKVRQAEEAAPLVPRSSARSSTLRCGQSNWGTEVWRIGLSRDLVIPSRSRSDVGDRGLSDTSQRGALRTRRHDRRCARERHAGATCRDDRFGPSAQPARGRVRFHRARPARLRSRRARPEAAARETLHADRCPCEGVHRGFPATGPLCLMAKWLLRLRTTAQSPAQLIRSSCSKSSSSL